ncbi:MAG: oligosaccharide flippase family protein [Paludibacteraceae bacterium]|nr:oligosaccharide flippase family protein [Paludibacteraceae bacterium]
MNLNINTSNFFSFFLKKKIFKNVLSLGFMQVANSVIPLLVIPFVVRALGTEEFGQASYAQNIIAYFTLLVNFGFEYSATQDIALNVNDKGKVQSIFWTVIKSKFLLLLISFVLFSGLLFYNTEMQNHLWLYLSAFLMNVGVVLYPSWFYQGIEDTSRMAVVSVLVRLVGAVMTVLLVTLPSDCQLYVLLWSLSYVGVGLFTFLMAVSKYKLSYTVNISYDSIKKGFPIFLNNLFSNIYALGGLTIIGMYLSDHEIGIYAGANKIIAALCMLLSMPISLSLFPSLSRSFATSLTDGWKRLKECLFYIVALGLLMTVVIFAFAPLFVEIVLGGDFEESIGILRALSCIPFLVVVATMFTIQGLYGMQMQKYAPIVGAFVSITSIICYFLLISKYGVYGAVIGYVISELLEILIVYSLLRFRLSRIDRKNKNLF